jgi:hypothetical protein
MDSQLQRQFIYLNAHFLKLINRGPCIEKAEAHYRASRALLMEEGLLQHGHLVVAPYIAGPGPRLE